MSENHGRRTRRWRKISAEFRAQCQADNAPCWLCGQPIDYTITDPYDDDAFEPDHYYPVSSYPQHAEDTANLRPSHRGCNRARGNDMSLANLGTISQAFH